MGHKDPGQWRNNLLQLKELLQCASVNASVLRLDDLEHALQLPRVRGQFMLVLYQSMWCRPMKSTKMAPIPPAPDVKIGRRPSFSNRQNGA